MSAKVYLVGAGPGAHDLITVRGLNILKEADVVIYDYLVDKSLLEYAKDEAELVCSGKLAKKGKYSDGSYIEQDKISELVIKKVKEGKKVIRLKNGDPSIFSRNIEELEAIERAGIEFEIVPGITAAGAASCVSGIPLTDRKFASSCVFITAHEDPAKQESFIDWDAAAKSGTVVLYMGVANLEKITMRLIEAGKPVNTSAALMQDVSLPSQRILTGTLKDIAQKAKKYKIKPPAIVIVGDVVKYEKKFNWSRKNKSILFTGLSDERFFIEGSYYHLPLISIEELDDYRDFDSYLMRIQSFDWIVFASRYGVKYFFKRLAALGYDSRKIEGINIAAVGRSTAEALLGVGIKADLIPEDESSKGLVERLRKEGVKGMSIFMPRSDLSDKGLKEDLEALGARVSESVAYANVISKDLPDIVLDDFDQIMFTSPSTVRSFVKRYKKAPKKTKIKCIGDVTFREAQRCKLLD
ncbi:MAG: uroporphyrinogen-III C-methyltransferase [bacterium]